ncbi:MAG: hypothetical protein IIB60_00245 [Planctomycetes bacterium]|nr:hypothetical protein [Planctomycetota bacterium]
MRTRIQRWIKRLGLAGAGAGALLFQAQGCSLDPDLALRAAVSVGSDVAIFLLENLAVGL